MPLADYQTLVDDLVRDRDQVIAPAQRDAAISAAVAQYSVGNARAVVVDVVSTGGQRIDLPAGFTDDSALVSVEIEVGSIPPIELPLADISIYRAPTMRQLDLPLAVDAGETLRVTYTAAHQLDAASDTVPLRHRLALASLAGSILCGQLASYYATEGEPSIGADTVDYKNKSDRWRLRQKDLAADYARIVGVAPNERARGASATAQLERADALGQRRMFHPTRTWPR